MENGPFVSDFPIKTSIQKDFQANRVWFPEGNHLEILPDRSTELTSGVSTAKSSAGESSPAKSGWRMRTSPTKKLGLKGMRNQHFWANMLKTLEN